MVESAHYFYKEPGFCPQHLCQRPSATSTSSFGGTQHHLLVSTGTDASMPTRPPIHTHTYNFKTALIFLDCIIIVCVCHGAFEEVRRQVVGVDSLLPLRGPGVELRPSAFCCVRISSMAPCCLIG